MTTTLQIKTPRWSLPLLDPHRYKGAYGGRGSGKSHFFAEMLIESHVINPDRYSVCIREVQSSIRMSVKRLLELKIQTLGLESYFEVQEAQIKSIGSNNKGTGVIIFQGMQNHTAESIKSLEGFDTCWCEESQSLSQRSLDMLRPTIRKDGSEMWFSWNPDKPTDAIDVLLRSDELPYDAVVVRVNYDDNPWFPFTPLPQEMEFDRRRDPDKYAHVWMGEYQQNSEARVFHNWKVEEFETPPDALHRQGIDFGYSKDPATMVRNHIIGTNLYIDYEAYRIGCEINHLPKLFLESVPDCEKTPTSADSARPDLISYLKKHGFPRIFGAKKGKNSIIQGITFLQSYDIIIHPRCVHTIDEFSRYSWKVDPMTDLITTELVDKKNHIIDPLRYANEAHRRLAKRMKQTQSEPIPTTNRWNDDRRAG